MNFIKEKINKLFDKSLYSSKCAKIPTKYVLKNLNTNLLKIKIQLLNAI